MAEGTTPVPQSGAVAEKPELIKGLGLVDATTLVMGSMIGSGIFIVSADIVRQVPSPGGLLLVWGVTAILMMIGALSYGELAAMMPKAGGMYVYLREAYSPLWGFLYGWTTFLVIGSATIAAVAIAFAKFTGIFFPWFSSGRWLFGPLPLGSYNLGLNTQNLLAIISIVVLTWVNLRGLRTGAMVQNLFTFAKVAAVVGLVLLGLTIARSVEAVQINFSDFWRGLEWNFDMFVVLSVAMVGSLFASFAWENVTFTAGETKNPSRNIPLSLALGVGAVMTLYLLTNVTYLVTLPLEGDPNGASVAARGIQFAAEDRVGAAAGEMVFGPLGAYLMAAAIMISTFGCNNGLILAYPRVYYAMARDGVFFRRLGELNPRTHAPAAALVLQGVWASALTLSGTYSDLLDYVIFAVLLFYMLTIGGVIVLRQKWPEVERPYRAFGYPVLPAVYIGVSLFIAGCILVMKPRFSWPGLLLVVLGVPVYWLWKRQAIAERG